MVFPPTFYTANGHNLGNQFANLRWRRRLFENSVRELRLRLDKLFMHRLNRFPELLAHRLRRPPAQGDITNQSPLQSNSRRALQENFQPKQFSQRWTAQQPQALHHDDWCGRKFHPNLRTRVRREIVGAKTRFPPGQRCLQDFFQHGPVNRPRIIEIDLGAAQNGNVRAGAIKIVE